MVNSIATINNVTIKTVSEGSEIFVPIKPICAAIGVDYPTQWQKIQDDAFLSSTIGIIPTEAANGKVYEMACLPLKYIYGWLFSINPGKVAPNVRVAVAQYRMECYNTLYDHFTNKLRHTVEMNNEEIALLKEINAAITEEKDAKSRRRQAEAKLSYLRKERLNPTPSLFL